VGRDKIGTRHKREKGQFVRGSHNYFIIESGSIASRAKVIKNFTMGISLACRLHTQAVIIRVTQ
jgi:hypothetical protein